MRGREEILMKKILVVADLVEQAPIAIKQAEHMAELLGASLHIVHFCYVDLHQDDADSASIKSQVMASVQAQAEKLIAKVLPEGLSYSHSVEWCKHIDTWVCDYAKVEKPCLVVKTGHRSETMFYTPTDWGILRDCPTPVLIAADKKWKHHRNIMACIDLGTRQDEKRALNRRILKLAREIADKNQVDMHVAYCPSAPPILRELGLRHPEEVEQRVVSTLADEIEAMVNEYAMDRSQLHIRAGLAEKVIPSLAADCDASMVVIGTVGRKGVKGKMLGNTAEKILTLLKTDVLALKP